MSMEKVEMATHLFYRNHVITLIPTVISGKFVFEVYIDTYKIMNVPGRETAKRVAVQFIDTLYPSENT